MKLISIFVTALAVSTALAAAPIEEKDLAIVLDTGLSNPVKASDRLSEDALLPRPWYESLKESFQGSSVGNALAEENRYSDWQLVSARLVPCNPLVRSMNHQPSIYCWPEVRLVIQPVMARLRTRAGMIAQNFADDRAIHLLYDVPSSLLKEDANEAEVLKSKIHDLVKNQIGSEFSGLKINDQSQFIELRNRLSRILMTDALGLRSPGISVNDYSGHGLRPELYYGQAEGSFRSKLIVLLSKYAFPQNLKAMTGFSLPAGREPAHTDEWVFVAFEPTNDGNIKLKNVPVFSMNDGAEIVTLPSVTVGTMGQDSALFYDLDLSVEPFNQLTKQVLIFEDENRDAAAENIIQTTKTTVENTSCASCHRLNTPIFNFHNFSKFETDEVNVSQRVVNDVIYDMDWLSKHLN